MEGKQILREACFVEGERKLIKCYFDDKPEDFLLLNNSLNIKTFESYKDQYGYNISYVLEGFFKDGFIIGTYEEHRIIRIDAYNYVFDKIATANNYSILLPVRNDVGFERFVRENSIKNSEEMGK